ncbi:MAG: phosphatase PAP2 family protein, partial [Microbacteriaceae bacterium]
MRMTRLNMEPLKLPFRSWATLALAGALLAITLIVGLVARSQGPLSPELGADKAMSTTREPLANVLALAVNAALSTSGNAVILVLVTAWLIWGRRAPIKALAVLTITSAGWLSSEAGKLAVARMRPPAGVTHALVIESGPSSFPSGHTAFAAAFSSAVILVLAKPGLWRRLAIAVGIAFTCLVGLSRLYLGVHYPTDVIGAVL